MTSLDEQLDRLASFEPSGLPVISLYLNAQADEHGKDRFDRFLRKELPARIGTYVEATAERDSLEKDAARIREYLATQLQPSSNGIAIFACSGAGFFEAVQLNAPIEDHALFIGELPNLYMLARVNGRYPRYAVAVADTNAAKIFVLGLCNIGRQEEIRNVKTRRTAMGGWSQARYQRHADNLHLHHVKEVVDTLDRIVREEAIERVIFGGDEVVVPLIRDQMPKALAEKVIDVLRIDVRAPEREIVDMTIEALHRRDSESDAEKVRRLFDEYRGGGLGVVGVKQTLAALGIGQVDELLIVQSPQTLEPDGDMTTPTAPPDSPRVAALDQVAAADTQPGEQDPKMLLADALVTAARQTGAAITFIEDASLMKEAGGVGAFLRYRI